jgi:tRNA U34 5-methylaminomethyl-2-thiouridine-forming methyltransferase MnmC
VGSGFQNALMSNRFENISILDVGMGLGYNSSAAVASWLESSGVSNLEILSLEIDSSLAAEFISGHARWCANWSEPWLFGVKQMTQVSHGSYVAKVQHPVGRGELTWRVEIGDASQFSWRGAEKFDFIWQDPFTPDLNPGLWSAAWFRTLRDGCHEGAVLMTYSASRVVKDALSAAGWTVSRIKTPGKKRHWLKATNIFRP